jgi:hypothetical protein
MPKDAIEEAKRRRSKKKKKKKKAAENGEKPSGKRRLRAKKLPWKSLCFFCSRKRGSSGDQIPPL